MAAFRGSPPSISPARSFYGSPGLQPTMSAVPPPPTTPDGRILQLSPNANVSRPLNFGALAAAVGAGVTQGAAAVTIASQTGGGPGATFGAAGTATSMTAVGPLSLWQFNNGGLDAAVRVGGLVGAVLLWRHGHKAVAGVAAAAAGALWANRLGGLNL